MLWVSVALHRSLTCLTTHMHNHVLCLQWHQLNKIFFVKHFNCCGVKEMLPTTLMIASYPGSRWAGKERAWYTLFAHAFNLPKIWGLWGIFWFFRVMWRQSSDSIMYTYQNITMACNESLDCSTATDLLNFVRSIITVSKLCLHFAHLRFSKPSSSLYPTEPLIVDASLSWLAFLPNNGNATLWWL